METTSGSKLPPVARMSNYDLRSFGIDNLIHLIRQMDTERLNALREQSTMMKDVNSRLQTHLMEIRSLKEVNQKLQEENQEVRDLACFLDDDRQKGRKLAREWQRFGRYTSGVMKSELTVYQQKLKELEQRQEELLKENIELKELCLYLDQELKRFQRRDSMDRDDGDGSSSSSPTGEKVEDEQTPPTYEELNRVPLNERTTQYIRQLEQQVLQLEQEKKQPPGGKQHVEFRKYLSTPQLSSQELMQQRESTSRPESVQQALRVLEIQEKLEKRHTENTTILDDAEKAIVQQMCNVVWQKLGDA